MSIHAKKQSSKISCYSPFNKFNLPDFPLIARFFCRKIVALPPLKVAVVFHQVGNRLLFATLPPQRRFGERQAQEAVAGGALGCSCCGRAVTAAVAVAAAAAAVLQAVGRAEATQVGHFQVVAAQRRISSLIKNM